MPLTLGCDPEFMVVGPENRSILCNISYQSRYGEVGSDHGNRVGEMRPAPGTPTQVVENLRHLFHHVKTHHPQIKIVCGGGEQYHEATGGHIHFGMSWDSFWSSHDHGRRRRQTNFGNNHQGRLITTLDYFLGLRLKKVPGAKRSGQSYGKPGDVRMQPHGFEYRTPPSWITDPVLAESVLAIAYQIAKMWQVKPTAFDHLITAKRVARKREYAMLVPESGPEQSYYATQIANFKRIVFSKTYRLDNPNCIELWTNPNPNLIQSDVTATSRRSRRGSERIQLQICQLKIIHRENEFEQETVFKVCRFAVSEVRIYPLGDYTPWQLQLSRDIRLRPNTIYFSKELRPFLKIPRSSQYRARFIEIHRRNLVSTTSQDSRVQSNPLNNSVFYNSRASNPNMSEDIARIFETCVRKKMRREVEA